MQTPPDTLTPLETVHATLIRKAIKSPLRSKKVWAMIGTIAGIAGAAITGIGGPWAIVGVALTGASYVIAQGGVDAATITALGRAASAALAQAGGDRTRS